MPNSYYYAVMGDFKKILKSMSYRGEYLLVLLFSALIKSLSLRACHRLGDLLGVFFFRVVRIRREVTLDQLTRAFPGKSPDEIREYGVACYKNMCRLPVEMMKFQSLNHDRLSMHVKVKGRHHLDEGLKSGKGLVIVTFHLGNWELGGACLAGLGYPLSVVVQRIHNPYIDNLIAGMRKDAGMKPIPRDKAVKGSIRAMKANEMVVFLADQDARESGVFVPYFGRPTSTPRGPAVLSIHQNVPAVMVFVLRKEDGSYELSIEPILFERVGDLEKDVETFTRKFTSRLEEHVRDHPEQWLWQHRRWKTVSGGAA